MKKLMIMILASAVLLGACAQADVVLKYSRESLNKLTNQFPNVVSETEKTISISADGETVLNISKDYSAGQDDIVMATPLQPFVDAGLDVAKLPEGFRADGGTLYLTTDFGDEEGEAATVADALFSAADANRDALTYHAKLDHYGITLAAGKFEFAKDYTTNDKDIVFVLKADKIAETGADVNSIKGWTFATMDDGSQVLLKPADLG